MNEPAEITIKIPPPPARSHWGNVKLKPYTFWLPDPEDPAFQERIHKQCLALRNDPEEQEWDRWSEAALAEAMKDEPVYD